MGKRSTTCSRSWPHSKVPSLRKLGVRESESFPNKSFKTISLMRSSKASWSDHSQASRVVGSSEDRVNNNIWANHALLSGIDEAILSFFENSHPFLKGSFYAVNTFRPFLRRRLIIFLPLTVLMRFLKPMVVFLLFLLGWNVRFTYQLLLTFIIKVTSIVDGMIFLQWSSYLENAVLILQ